MRINYFQYKQKLPGLTRNEQRSAQKEDYRVTPQGRAAETPEKQQNPVEAGTNAESGWIPFRCAPISLRNEKQTPKQHRKEKKTK